MDVQWLAGVGRQVWINRRFRHLWTATSASNLADGINLAAVPLLAALLTRDPTLVAGVTVVQRLPWFLFSLVSGGIVDRFDRRNVLLIANTLRSVAIGGVGVAAATGSLSIPVLYVLFFLYGTAETLFDNAVFALVPSLVTDGTLEKANGRLFSTQTVANEFAGPSIGGVLFALLMAAPFVVGAGLYAASVAFALLIDGRFRPDPDDTKRQTTFRADVEEGVRWFWSHSPLRTLGLMAGAANFVSAATMSILVLFAQSVLGVGDVGFGILLSSAAVGGIFGGVTSAWLSEHVKPGRLIFATNLLAAGSYVGLSFVRTATGAAVLLPFVSFVVMVQNVVIVSLRQKLIPDGLLGRVTGAYRMVGLGGLPFGAFVGGLLASVYSLTTPFLIGGVLLFAVSFAVLPVVNDQRIADAI